MLPTSCLWQKFNSSQFPLFWLQREHFHSGGKYRAFMRFFGILGSNIIFNIGSINLIYVCIRLILEISFSFLSDKQQDRQIGQIDRTGTDRTGTDRTGTDRTGTDMTGTDRTETDRTGTDRTGKNRTDKIDWIVGQIDRWI